MSLARFLKPPPQSPQDRRALGALALILVMGLVLRFWGLGWGLPDARHPFATYHPDELINLNAARTADIPHFQLDIGFYNYGAFYFYLVSFAHTLGRGWGLIPASPADAASHPELLAPENAALFLAGRMVTALLGVATIAALYFLGRRLYGRKAGLLGAALYAVAPLAVVHGHFLTVDVPATFFVVMALLWSARMLERQDWANYVGAGVWTGLAAATKYTAALVIVAPIVAHFCSRKPDSCPRHRAATLGVMLVSAGFAFLIGCPGPVINWEVFWNGTYPGSGVRYELLTHSREGHGELFAQTGFGGWYHLVISLRYGLTTPLTLLGLAGGVLALRQRTAGDRFLAAFFVVSYLSASLSAVRFARYMIPLFPVLALWGGRLLVSEAIRAKQSLRFAVALGVGLIALVSSGGYCATMRQKDPRDLAADFLERSAAQGASVAFAKTPWFFSPPLSPRFGLPAAPQRAQAAQETTRFALRISQSEWDASLLDANPDFVTLSNLEALHSLRLRQENALRFIERLKTGYRAERFGVTSPWGGFAEGELVPEDLLYVAPVLTVYARL